MPLPTITTARTPIHGMPYLFPGQAQKEAFVNEAFALLDALVQPVVLGELAEPPASPARGDSYLVAQSAAGPWAGKESAIAVWAESQWLFLQPQEGARVHELASQAQVIFTQAEGWKRVSAPALPQGGATQDAEARNTIATLISALREAGIFSA